MASQFAGQGVQLVSGRLHVLWLIRDIQRGQQPAEPFPMSRLYAGFRSSLSKSSQPFMPVAPDHAYSLAIRDSLRNRNITPIMRHSRIRSGQSFGEADVPHLPFLMGADAHLAAGHGAAEKNIARGFVFGKLAAAAFQMCSRSAQAKERSPSGVSSTTRKLRSAVMSKAPISP